MKRKFRFITGILVFGILFTAYIRMFGIGPVFAESESSLTEESQDQNEAKWQDKDGNWQAGSFAEAIANVSNQGVVVLLSDVSLTNEITINKSLVITSNETQKPCVIRNMGQDTDDGKSRGRIFTVTAGELRLQDIILDGGRDEGVTAYHPLICVSGGAILRMLDGAILKNAENASQSMCGGGINVRLGQVYLYEGSRITQCKARHGGGIELNSSSSHNNAMLAMGGGSIDGCEADEGGGVYVNIGAFQMLGGKITDNHATGQGQSAGGGGIYVIGSASNTKGAAVRIKNGEITHNKAESNGGGIMIHGARAQVELMGGTLKENKAKCGGGVSVSHGTLKLQGGTVTDNTAGLYGGGILGSPNSVINLEGSPQVFDNTSGDTTEQFDNLYLDGAEDEDASEATAPVRLTGALTEGVKLGMSRWVRPDESEHPYREMIVPGITAKGEQYTISQSDFDRLCDDRQSDDKQLYADNMEKYALIPYDGKIVMVLAVGITLDRDSLSLKTKGDTGTLTASVTPDNAPVNEVTWTSSDESVATVDENGKVTAVGKGTALIKATTVSPYHETASCNVTVGKFRLTTRTEHGEIQYISDAGGSDGDNEIFEEDDRIILQVVPDEGYQLKEGSLKACQTDDELVMVGIEGNTLNMPDHDVIVTAEFEPVSYPITYHLEGGTLEEDKTNPGIYTIESKEIILNNPTRSGYSFVGWTGTELEETEVVVKIPSGSTGAREYTAVWKKDEYKTPVPSVPTEKPKETEKPKDTEKPKETEKPKDTEKPKETEKPEDTEKPKETKKPEETEKPKETEKPENTEQPKITEKSEDTEQPKITEKPEDTERPKITEKPENTDKTKETEKPENNGTTSTQTTQSPQTGSHILWMYAAAILSGLCMLILTFFYRKWRKQQFSANQKGKRTEEKE